MSQFIGALYKIIREKYIRIPMARVKSLENSRFCIDYEILMMSIRVFKMKCVN